MAAWAGRDGAPDHKQRGAVRRRNRRAISRCGWLISFCEIKKPHHCDLRFVQRSMISYCGMTSLCHCLSTGKIFVLYKT
jgi:hypothetical protein